MTDHVEGSVVSAIDRSSATPILHRSKVFDSPVCTFDQNSHRSKRIIPGFLFLSQTSTFEGCVKISTALIALVSDAHFILVFEPSKQAAFFVDALIMHLWNACSYPHYLSSYNVCCNLKTNKITLLASSFELFIDSVFCFERTFIFQCAHISFVAPTEILQLVVLRPRYATLSNINRESCSPEALAIRRVMLPTIVPVDLLAR